jgi:hypothetical protein
MMVLFLVICLKYVDLCVGVDRTLGVDFGELTSEQRNAIRNSLVEAEQGGDMCVKAFVAGGRKCKVSLLSRDKSMVITTTGTV